ncbi:LysR family transcriptional regulator [Xanthomonas citri]|uniref:LysR family transcriptional regulator n=1 Tax=Xanthomonas citri TaxID=346 RepID=UPI000247CD8C|nr:LysR family transcriptional regulator [Xanthomonas citri]MBE0316275.1 LysR family transcriptional regulator [Xanthomonas citri pv. punicae]MDS0758891.1 LysR family transcriptional regulator [Xanthomonas citri pv. punicae]MDS0762667.1 LysR family transcriptional regulator [Xanthomonas citri pv. punicae]MDS0797438.1 LysR family transcriptional regulator [Xanthomonas citri pv. punicae]MDS0830072.1 LysR family transcriptional regulator [Xanthomonas citri pv. punicae]
MDLASLNAFVAIAESGSFSAAGEALHLTQPAVSKRIALLEAQLSARLFDRLGRQVVLTEAGQALLPRAQRILAELQDTRRVLEHLGAAVGGRLSLATSHHVGLHRLPALLRGFATRHPQAIQFLDSELAYAAVLRGEVELAVTTLAPDTRAPLRAQPIWHDRLQFVVAPDHPLAALPAVSLDDVVTHPAVLPDPGTFTHRIVANLFAERGLVPSLRMTTNYLETIKMLVSVGLAWSVLPERMIDHQIVALPLADVALSRELGCVTHGGRTLSRAAQAFVALLHAQADLAQA